MVVLVITGLHGQLSNRRVPGQAYTYAPMRGVATWLVDTTCLDTCSLNANLQTLFAHMSLMQLQEVAGLAMHVPRRV
jgi:hypothetical protein